ncbi:MAG: response regulator [Planctomycetes bacterium]|nr:response regulator [Planctomycetota bacterium]
MERHKTVLTTGEVAKICSVAPRTVSKWFDAGHLRGYRIPGSKDRRIPVDQLIRFMRAHGIPLNGLDGGKRRVLVLDADAALSDALRTALENDGGFEVTTVGSALEAGAAAVELKPHVIVVDVSLPDVIPQAMVRFQRSNCDLQTTSLIGVSTNLSNGQGQALLQQGFAGFLSKPFETAALIRVIEQTANFTPAHTVG